MNKKTYRTEDNVLVTKSGQGFSPYSKISYYCVADSVEKLESWWGKLCADYHPAGYGTTRKPIRREPNGSFSMSCHRYASCD